MALPATPRRRKRRKTARGDEASRGIGGTLGARWRSQGGSREDEAMRRAKNLASLLAVAASACAADLSLGTAAGVPGQPVNLSVTLRTVGANIAGVQFDLSYDKTALGISEIGRASCRERQ